MKDGDPLPAASPQVTELYVYPIKGAGGIRIAEAAIDDFGIAWDRRWMVAGVDGVFLSQRDHPRMALVRTAFEGEGLRVEAPGMPALHVPFSLPRGSEPIAVEVWGDQVAALSVGDVADAWFTRFLGVPASLVHVPSGAGRRVDPDFADPHPPSPGLAGGARVSFSDGYPLLLLSEESLEELNRRIALVGDGPPLGWDRFRPNVVVRGGRPHVEDGWRAIRIGAIDFHVAKPCARCTVTTVDQESGQSGKEPLRTMARYRRAAREDGRVGGKVYFGQNLVHRSRGQLQVGERVLILEEGEPRPRTTDAETIPLAFR